MSRYIQHLQQLSNPKTFQRKKDYIDYNLKPYFGVVGYKNIKVFEIGPGLGEFESYLNDKGIFDIDIVDNDKSVLDFVSRKYKIKKSLVSKNIPLLNSKLGKYNLIFLMQVFEHLPIEQYKKIILTLFNHLNDNGFLIIVVPNGSNPLGIVERYADLQHNNCFTEQSLKDLVNLVGLKNYEMEIKGYEVPPYDLINVIRKLLQKILHFVLLIIMVINGGVFFKTMTPNIMLIIKKN